MHVLLAASHTRTVLSSLLLARDRPSGLHATMLVTAAECPCGGTIHHGGSHPEQVGASDAPSASSRWGSERNNCNEKGSHAMRHEDNDAAVRCVCLDNTRPGPEGEEAESGIKRDRKKRA